MRKLKHKCILSELIYEHIVRPYEIGEKGSQREQFVQLVI